MYALDEVAADAERFREAFARDEGYRPLYVKIKLLYGCNLHCRMCNHWREARPRQLGARRLREVLAELRGMGCRKVHFTGGEPALRPDLEELVAHAASLGIRPTLTTNGTLLTRERRDGSWKPGCGASTSPSIRPIRGCTTRSGACPGPGNRRSSG